MKLYAFDFEVFAHDWLKDEDGYSDDLMRCVATNCYGVSNMIANRRAKA